MRQKLAIIVIWVIAYGCIGTDVLEEIILPAMLKITSTISSIRVGDTVPLEYVYFNDLGLQEEVPVSWSSSNNQIISIDQTGLATANNPGDAYIFVEFETLIDSLFITAGDTTVSQGQTRTGTFRGRNNYNVAGNFSLMINMDSKLQLSFDSNFEAAIGPGLYVYLANSDQSVTGGYEAGPLKNNKGAQDYILPENITINMYDYVIIYCKPFGVIFGDGKFD